METIKIRLKNVALRGYKKGAVLYINPADPYWARCLEESKDTDIIEIINTSAPVKEKKSQSAKTKETN